MDFVAPDVSHSASRHEAREHQPVPGVVLRLWYIWHRDRALHQGQLGGPAHERGSAPWLDVQVVALDGSDSSKKIRLWFVSTSVTTSAVTHSALDVRRGWNTCTTVTSSTDGSSPATAWWTGDLCWRSLTTGTMKFWSAKALTWMRKNPRVCWPTITKTKKKNSWIINGFSSCWLSFFLLPLQTFSGRLLSCCETPVRGREALSWEMSIASPLLRRKSSVALHHFACLTCRPKVRDDERMRAP